MNVIEQPLAVRFGSHVIKGDILHAVNDTVKLVLLHGAGLGTRERYRGFRTSLAQRSIASLAFDFIGFGETGGEISESSLQSRTEQACAVIDAMKVYQPFCVLGASMGAYTAIKLVETYPLTSMILFVPAAYDIAAYAVPFGSEFTNVIRRPNSWVRSDAWSILRSFHGRLLMVVGGEDDIIPQDVIRRLYEAGENTSKREIYSVKDSPHLLIHYLSQHEQENEHVLQLVQEYVDG